MRLLSLCDLGNVWPITQQIQPKMGVERQRATVRNRANERDRETVRNQAKNYALWRFSSETVNL